MSAGLLQNNNKQFFQKAYPISQHIFPGIAQIDLA
jgi:hypothetical protein